MQSSTELRKWVCFPIKEKNSIYNLSSFKGKHLLTSLKKKCASKSLTDIILWKCHFGLLTEGGWASKCSVSSREFKSNIQIGVCMCVCVLRESRGVGWEGEGGRLLLDDWLFSLVMQFRVQQTSSYPSVSVMYTSITTRKFSLLTSLLCWTRKGVILFNPYISPMREVVGAITMSLVQMGNQAQEAES